MFAKLTNDRVELQKYFVSCLGDSIDSISDISCRPLEIDLKIPNLVKTRVYLFPATNPPGGRSKDEYKVNLTVPGQLSGEKGNFDWSDSRIVLLVTYVKEFDVFVFFNPFEHNNFACNSNLQMKLELFTKAAINGIAEYERKNGEVLIACKSSRLVECLDKRIRSF